MTSRTKNAKGGHRRARSGWGVARVIGSRPDQQSRAVIAPAPIAEGQVQCPVCRRGVNLRADGKIGGHVDLFGEPCRNRFLTIPDLEFDIPEPFVAVRPSDECPECGRKTPQNKDGSWRKHRIEADNWLAPYCGVTS